VEDHRRQLAGIARLAVQTCALARDAVKCGIAIEDVRGRLGKLTRPLARRFLRSSVATLSLELSWMTDDVQDVDHYSTVARFWASFVLALVVSRIILSVNVTALTQNEALGVA
jgi:hypothetical protein